MKYLRAFVAGIAFPAIVFPFVTLALSINGMLSVLGVLPLYMAPIIWGLWNMLYFAVGKKCPIKERNSRLAATGATLGFILGLFIVFVFNAPYLLFGITGYAQYIVLIIVPLVYTFLWRYVVKFFNSLLGLKEW